MFIKKFMCLSLICLSYTPMAFGCYITTNGDMNEMISKDYISGDFICNTNADVNKCCIFATNDKTRVVQCQQPKSVKVVDNASDVKNCANFSDMKNDEYGLSHSLYGYNDSADISKEIAYLLDTGLYDKTKLYNTSSVISNIIFNCDLKSLEIAAKKGFTPIDIKDTTPLMLVVLFCTTSEDAFFDYVYSIDESGFDAKDSEGKSVADWAENNKKFLDWMKKKQAEQTSGSDGAGKDVDKKYNNKYENRYLEDSSLVLGCVSQENESVRNSEFSHYIDEDLYFSEGINDDKETGVWLLCVSSDCKKDRNARYGWVCEKKQSKKESSLDLQKSETISALQAFISERSKIINDIKSAHAGDKKTVWKNDKGKLNTSRVVSDSVAGVAVGSVGGLVTASVIKKNQVKKGFEDLNCVQSGTKIADWGDEFSITGAETKTDCEAAAENGRTNAFVWASKTSTGNDFSGLVEDTDKSENNACWARVELSSNDPKISTDDMAARYFMIGGTETCGAWLDEAEIKKHILSSKKKGRVGGTIAGIVGGMAVGVGSMEAFGNKAIGGKVQGQKALNEEDLLKSQVLSEKGGESKW
ncbi:MAG: hypothetical protein WC137_01730, partial [Alphaproteobacteria bacterium]